MTKHKTKHAVSSENKSSASTEATYIDIATAAYYRAQARDFEPGNELQDWLDAEQEINADYS